MSLLVYYKYFQKERNKTNQLSAVINIQASTKYGGNELHILYLVAQENILFIG